MSVKTFLATIGQGLARATCGTSKAWSVEFLIPDRDVRCLAADLLNPDLVYAGTQGTGVLRSNDAGKTWQPNGLPRQTITAWLSAAPSLARTTLERNPPCSSYRETMAQVGQNLPHFVASRRAGSGSLRQRSPIVPMCRQLLSPRLIPRSSSSALKLEP